MVKGTLLERIVSAGMLSSRLLVDGKSSMVTQKYKKDSNGIVDTMQIVLLHDNFVKPWSVGHLINSFSTLCVYLLNAI